MFLRKYMANSVILLVLFLAMAPCGHQLQSSQTETLMRIRRFLVFPDVLSSWNDDMDFCNGDSSSFLTVACYGESITQLHIIGRDGSPALPSNFSIESFFTTLVSLPDLKVLTLASLGLWGFLPEKIGRFKELEILNVSSNQLFGAIPDKVWSLKNLQTLILDNNRFDGKIADLVSALPLLAVLSLKNNSLTGFLPQSLTTMVNLRVLMLSNNRFSGDLPDFSSLTNLQVLDVGNNMFGPKFPILSNKIVTLILRKNRISGGIPSDQLSTYYQLDLLDISSNRLVGPFPTSLFSLPSMHHLNVEGNKLTGTLLENMSCSLELEFVDLSGNLLSGYLPSCLQSKNKNKVVQYWRNCLVNTDQEQHPEWYCQNQALAVGVVHPERMKASNKKAVVVISSLLGLLLVIATAVLLVFLIRRRVILKRMIKRPPRILIAENPSTGISSKLLSDARFISQSRKLGALAVPQYRSYSLEELEEATGNFDISAVIGEGSHGQIFRGHLKNGYVVAIRCLKPRKRQTSQNLIHHIELLSKLRHSHLVSVVGHCFDCNFDDASISRIFIISEHVPNGNLRSRISEEPQDRLSWNQRIFAAIGIAKGIQFLHTGIVPGIYGNNLKSTNILLDQNLVPKIGSYNLTLWEETMRSEVGTASLPKYSKENRAQRRFQYTDKCDVYNFGLILVEMITGRPMDSQPEISAAKLKLQESITEDDAARKRLLDPSITFTYCNESLKTVMELCLRCLAEEEGERPSVEDVLWNLHFAGQVQDDWRRDSQSTEGSPIAISPKFFHQKI